MSRIFLILAVFALSACTKGGKAEFFDGAVGPDVDQWKVGNGNPAVQFGIGGGQVIESGKTLSNGYHASILLKADNAQLLEKDGYTMTVNPVKIK